MAITINHQTNDISATSGSLTIDGAAAGGGATDIDGLSDGYSDGSSVGLGSGALASDDGSDNRNTAVGYEALFSSATSFGNVAFGYHALRNNSSGGSSTASGYEALISNTTGFSNTASGFRALRTNTTGSNNTASGYESLRNTSTGSFNTAFGYDALRSNTSNGNNTAVGYRALRANTGSNNTALGVDAGVTITTGSNNLVLGYQAAPSLATVSNEVTLGDSSISTLRCQVTTITSLSDARDKKDVKPLNAGLDFVKALKPVSFTWDMRDGGKVGQADTGFIAQDLQSAQTNTGVTIPDLVFDENPNRLEAGYGKLIPVLVQAIKDLSAEVETLKSQREVK